jgi:hypothetical protein
MDGLKASACAEETRRLDLTSDSGSLGTSASEETLHGVNSGVGSPLDALGENNAFGVACRAGLRVRLP